MIEHATLIGWGVMISEFAIGIATLTGVALELAALGGFGMSIILWLSASWTVKPYFLGSDTAYAVLWLALFLLVRQNFKGRRGIKSLIPNLSDRREVFRLVSVGIVAVGAALAGGKMRTNNPTPEAGTAIATLAELPIGATKNFTAADGSAAVLFRSKAGVFAYSRICTHQGCTVNYDAGSNTLLCPCHGAAFDPTKDAAVVSGPAPAPACLPIPAKPSFTLSSTPDRENSRVLSLRRGMRKKLTIGERSLSTWPGGSRSRLLF